MSDYAVALIGVGGTVVGTVLGCGLTYLLTVWRERPKLCFSMVSTPDSELIEKELRTKTSLSENGIEIYNVGGKPFILEYFSLLHNGKLLVDCIFGDGAKVIPPYQSEVYTLDEQESDALQWHCDQDPFESCDVVAHSVDKKELKGSLETPIFALRARDKLTDSIVQK